MKLFAIKTYARSAALAMLGLSAFAAQPYLYNQAAYPLPVAPNGLVNETLAAKGDFNGDGLTDVVVLSQGSTCAFVVYLGSSVGALTPGTPVACSASVGRSIYGQNLFAADFNGDKKLDILVVNGTTSTASVYLGNGDGTFQSPVSSTVGPIALTVGDLNGDGFADLIESSGANAEQVSVYLSNGDGTFRSPVTTTVGNQIYLGAAAGDFNHDGNLDLAVTDLTGSTDSVAVLMGNGDGTFAPPVEYPLPAAGGTSHLLAVDVNQDGNLDLVADGPVVFPGRHDGTFATAVVSAITGTRNSDLFDAADFNRDGIPDLLTDQGVLLGDGHGKFYFGPGSIGIGETPTSLGYSNTGQAIDVNGDGCPDVVSLYFQGGRVNSLTVALGNGDGSLVSSRPRAFELQQVYGMATADFNGDGKPDLVSYFRPGSVAIALGNGNGTFREPVKILTSGPISGMTVGDFNQDGKPDVALTLQSSNSVLILWGNGDGTLTLGPSLAVGVVPLCIAAADINGDGYLDLVVANNTDDTLSVLLGGAHGAFQPQIVSHLNSAGGPRSLVTGDFNGDGHPDVAVLTGIGPNVDQQQYVTVLLGNGGGAFPTQTTYAIGNGSTTEVLGIAAGDLRGAGIQDILVSCGTLYLLQGMGDGTFAPATIVPNAPAGGDIITPILLADLNGDGKLDLAFSGNLTYVMTGNGDDTFSTPQAYYGPAQNNYLAVGDFNNDGMPDLAMAGGIVLSNPAPSLSRQAVGFGKVKVSAGSPPQSITLSNLSSTPMQLISVSVDQVDYDNFAASGDNCPSPLLPGASCTIEAAFDPQAKGKFKGTLVITDSAAGITQTVSLSGTGK